nr:hypothetical protein [uncultured Cohaesibacter sp.]
MTTISGLGTGTFSTMRAMSPEDRVEQELQSLVDAGEISTDDQEALSTALDSISREMRSSAPTADSTPPSKEEIQEKIESLIASQVEAGTLTEEQADELSDLFEEVAQAQPGGAGPMGGPGGAGGPPPGPPPSSGAEEEDDSESSIWSQTDTTSDTSASDLLASFLEQLQEQNATGYSAQGNFTGQQSMLFSFEA